MLKRTPLKRGISSLKRTPLKRGGPIKKVAKTPERIAEDQLLKDMRSQFYLECKSVVGLKSAISHKRLQGERVNYHHVKPKSLFPEVEFCFEVILAVTMDEHTEVERDPSAFIANIERIKFVEDNWDGCKEISKEWKLNYMKNVKQ